MKQIVRVWRGDLRRVTASVVAIVTLLGLCVIPCLYAWFNIFSNWSPYEAEATGRIRVAVVNADEGVKLMGVSVNLGNEIISALEGNTAMGWVFLSDPDEALEGLYASDYYAAIIVPERFTLDAVSFLTGEAKNPKLYYYENEKKNAIASKITGKAKTAVRDQVNAAFVQTAASVLSSAVSAAKAGGLEPAAVLENLSERLQALSERLTAAENAVRAVQDLSSSAQGLVRVSDTLLNDVSSAIAAGQKPIDAAEGAVNAASDAADGFDSGSVALLQGLDRDLALLEQDAGTAFADLDSYQAFVSKDLAGRAALAASMRESAFTAAQAYEALGLRLIAQGLSDQAARYGRVYDLLAAMQGSADADWAYVSGRGEALRAELSGAREQLAALSIAARGEADGAVRSAVSGARTALSEAGGALLQLAGGFGSVSGALQQGSAALSDLSGGLSGTEQTLTELSAAVRALSAVVDRLSGSALLSKLSGVLSEDAEVLGAHLSSPVAMQTQALYPVREYGSAMAPFYTVLAQWVGSLLAAVLLRVRVKDGADLRSAEAFWGRYGLYALVGLMQGLIVSLGDLFYVHIQCLYPWRFVLAACVNGLVFSMIHFALVYALESVGQALAVILLVTQVAGAGGTYPVEVLPAVFQKLYPFMPFRYAMDAMRECVAGAYGNAYWRCIGLLLLFALAAAVLGLVLYRPARGLNRLIQQGKERSEIML